MDFEEVLDIAKIMGIALLGVFLFLYCGMSVVNRVNLAGEIAQIEQLRSDVQRVENISNEDVIGQVTAMNQAIARNQAYNKLWWADVTIPDAWDSVKPIEIPRSPLP